jgi:hypothetical protein
VKLYTITDGKLQEGVSIEQFNYQDKVLFPVIRLNIKDFFPVILQEQTYEKLIQNGQVTIYNGKLKCMESGQKVLVEVTDSTLFENILVVFRFWEEDPFIFCYTGDLKSQEEYYPFPGEIIFQSSNPKDNSMLAEIKKGAVIRIHKLDDEGFENEYIYQFRYPEGILSWQEERKMIIN